MTFEPIVWTHIFADVPTPTVTESGWLC